MAGKENETERMALVFHSGAYDRVGYGLTMALVALSTGMNVHSFFTHGALQRLIPGATDKLGDETGHAARELVEDGIDMGALEPISQQFTKAKGIGLKVYACVTVMALLDKTKDDLIPEVDDVIGLATYLDIARDAKVTFYI
ncbi:MAG: DsrE/DsrF/DrsH-like family protein [Candidatus Thorarchaeota archaeon]|jgi:peroxiredoxin family protein